MKIQTKVLGEVDLAVIETADGLSVISHRSIEELLISHSDRISYGTELLYANPPYDFGFKAWAKDSITGRTVPCVVGESSKDNLESEIARKYACNQAHVRAIDRAVIALLGMPTGKFYSSSEISVNVPNSSSEYAKTQTKPQEKPVERQPEKPVEKQEAGTIKTSESPVSAEYVLTDETTILFGNSSIKKHKYEALKGTENWKKFVAWVKTSELTFAHDDERYAQMCAIKKLEVA